MDTTIQFIPIMIVGFAASLGLTPLSRQIAMRLGVVDKPSQRKLHHDHKPLMGGLAIYVAFALSLLLFSPARHLMEMAAIVAGAGFLAFIGLLDDQRNLGVRTRLIAMMVATGTVVAAGIQIRLFNQPLLDIPLTLVWVLALINAVNFLDNMDGLAAGLTDIASGFFLLIAIYQGQVLVSMLAAALFGSAIGFLTYNFNPASTFMGDMGSLVLGFVLAVLAMKVRFEEPGFDITWLGPLLVLVLPIFDINLVVWTRLAEGRSPVEAGKDHTSHRIMSVGFSQRQTLLLLYLMCAVFGLAGLLLIAAPPDAAWRLSAFMVLLVAFLYAVMIWVRWRFQRRVAG